MSAIAAWVRADNAAAVAAGGPSFLRLNKRPFRFQQTIDPLGAAEVDVLRAQEVLQTRADQLKRLTELARPADDRVRRFECLGRLRLIDDPGLWQQRRVAFRVPPEGREAELDESTFGVVLTDGDPDILLDPAAWPLWTVRIEPAGSGATDRVTVRVDRRVWDAGPLRQRLVDGRDRDWFLDKIHLDVNGPRAEGFLRFLATGEA